MNLGIVTSYIIAGVIILGIVMMNFRVQNSGAELTLSQMNRQYVTDIADMLNDDLSNMGYDVIGVTQNPTTGETRDERDERIIDCAKSSEIRFYRNLCETDTECSDETRIPERITWELLTDEISTSNPDQRTLRRTEATMDENDAVVDEDITDINVGVTQFNIEYFDEDGLTVTSGCGTNATNIKQFKVTLEVQSREKIIQRASDDGRYIRSVWEKRFTPTNLQLQDN